MCELDFADPEEAERILSGCQLAGDDRELLGRLSGQLGEVLELAARLGPLLELAAAFVPPGAPPDFITAARVRRRVKAWLRLAGPAVMTGTWGRCCASGWLS